MNRTILVVSIALTALSLAACGTTPQDRSLSGAGIGAGTGAVAGLLLGGPLAGAIIGGAVGAGVGALTTPSQVDLGKPAWR